MPDDNLAEQHLAWTRSLSGVPAEPKADAGSATLSRRDNMTSTAEPVVGGGTSAEIEKALSRDDSKRRAIKWL